MGDQLGGRRCWVQFSTFLVVMSPFFMLTAILTVSNKNCPLRGISSWSLIQSIFKCEHMGHVYEGCAAWRLTNISDFQNHIKYFHSPAYSAWLLRLIELTAFPSLIQKDVPYKPLIPFIQWSKHSRHWNFIFQYTLGHQYRMLHENRHQNKRTSQEIIITTTSAANWMPWSGSVAVSGLWGSWATGDLHWHEHPSWCSG